VICPSFTFVSSANAVLRVGARPVFAEIEEATLGLDPADVERRLTARTTALIPSTTPEWPPTWSPSRPGPAHGLRTIEDAARDSVPAGAAARSAPSATRAA